MARDHIEFVQSQRMLWRRGLYGGARPDVDVRTLSFDPETEESSLVIRYPKGWRQEGAVRLAADEEFILLAGALIVNGRTYRHHDYAYLPAGYLREAAATPDGAVILTFFSGMPRIDPALSDPDPVADGLVEHVDMTAMPWDYKAFPQMRPGCGMKYLRADPRTGDETWLLTSPPHGTPPGGAGARETHPTVEEVFVLAGDLHGDRGVMQQGAYFWRPPHILHGPYGSRSGATSFYRTKGGPLVAEWTAEKVPFAYDPPYTPLLPAGLQLDADRGIMVDARIDEGGLRDPRAAASPLEPAWPAASVAWRLTALLAIAYMVSFLDRFAIGLLIEPIKVSLRLDDFQIGLLLGPAFAIFYLTLGPPIGLLADRYNRRNIVIAGFTIWSGMTALCGLASSFPMLFLARVGVGVGEAALAPCALSMIGDSFPPDRRARAIGLYMSGSSLGSASTFLLGGPLVAAVERWVAGGAAPAFAAWQIVFLLVGLPGILIAMLFFTVAEPRRRTIAARPTGAGFGASLPHFRREWRPYLMLLIAAGGMAAISGLIQWDVSLFQRTWGWGVARTGFGLGAAFLLTGIPGALLSGAVISRMQRRGDTSGSIQMMRAGLFLMLAGIGFAPLAPSAPLALALTGVGLLGQAIEVAAWPVALVNLTPSAFRSQAVAFYWSGVLVVSLLIGPAAVGAITVWLGDPARLRYAIVIVAALFGLPALIALATGMQAFRRAAALHDR